MDGSEMHDTKCLQEWSSVKIRRLVELSMDEAVLKQRVDRAIRRLQDHDAMLFELGVTERSITHKLGEYLQQEFLNWDVDCEYDRDTIDKKQLEGYSRSDSDSDGPSKVYPDVIVHQRKGPDDENRPSYDEDNLLVIEVKTKTDSRSDITKIEAFRGELGYRSGLFINFCSNNSFMDEEQHWRTG